MKNRKTEQEVVINILSQECSSLWWKAPYYPGEKIHNA